jgi:hypothetical protein
MPEPIFNLRMEQRALDGALRGGEPAARREASDLSADTHLDREVAQERAGEDDLLDAAAPLE